GSGRTRLIEEWRRRVEAQATWLIDMRPDPSGARRAWHPVRRALAQVYGIVERATEEEVRAAAWERPQDVAGLLEIFGLPGPIPPESEALRRREALASAVNSLRDAEGA